MRSFERRDSGDGTAFATADKPLQALFVHGLFLRGRESIRFAYRLRRHGIGMRRFHYRSRKESPQSVAVRLAQCLRTAPDLNVVAHSLGGLITLMALAEAPGWRGRAVLLGSPVRGSSVARRTLQLPAGAYALGAAADCLCHGLAAPAVYPGRIAVVAGTCNVGIGRLLAACPPPADGVVCLQETVLAGAARSMRFATVHLGLVYHRRIIDWTAHFIRAEI